MHGLFQKFGFEHNYHLNGRLQAFVYLHANSTCRHAFVFVLHVNAMYGSGV